ncbi:MAG: DUF1003 domain-containing protein [Hyphomicrobiales bacterium]|nr:DUF1003 domain-containing protein [Hyphomicrobiales bacterium]
MHRTLPELAGRWLGRKPEALSVEETSALQSAIDRQPVSRDVNVDVAKQEDLGDRIADGIARIGGSWSFIITFVLFLVVWTIGNVWLLGQRVFDPYPFIFLNLVLSMVAALQAPVIMMSQNRQSARDRIDAAHDYEVNLKAEIEIMALHEKLDEMRHSQIMILREDLAKLTSQLERIEALVTAPKA